MSFNMGGLEKLAKSALAFSKKNLPSIMVGGSILMSVAAVYTAIKQAPKAAKEVEEENEKREENEEPAMNRKEIFVTYLKYCWMSLALEGGSAALAALAHKIDLARLGEMYMLSQFYKEDGEKLKKQLLKQENGEQKLKELREQQFDDEHPVDDILKCPEYRNLKDGELLVMNETTDKQYPSTMTSLRNGFSDFNEMMMARYLDAYKKKYGEKLTDAFFSSIDSPYPINDENIYVTAKLDEFLVCIGEKDSTDIPSTVGELLEFHYYGNGPCVDFNKVTDFKKFIDPSTGKTVAVRLRRLDDFDLLYPAEDLMFRD